MKSLTGSLLALATLCAAGAAYGDAANGTPRFTWTSPTLNTDGSSIPATGTMSLKEYRIYCGTSAAAATSSTTPKKVIAHPTLTWQSVLGDFAVGTHYCNATAVNNATTQNESARSGTVSFTIPQPAPSTVGNFSVE